MVRAIVNLTAGDSPASLILRQRALIERYEAALEDIANELWGDMTQEQIIAAMRGIARGVLGEQVTA